MHCNNSYGLITSRLDIGAEAGTISNRIDFVDFVSITSPSGSPSNNLGGLRVARFPGNNYFARGLKQGACTILQA